MPAAKPDTSSRSRVQRRRTPVLLLWLLLANTLGVSVLSWIALRGQSAEIEANRRAASAHALAALAAQVEHAAYEAVQEPVLLLRNAPASQLDAGALAAIRAQQQELHLVQVLDGNFSSLQESPGVPADRRRFIAAAVQERVLGDALDGRQASVALRAVADADAEPPMLYAFVSRDSAGAAGAGGGSPGWLVFGFDVSRLAARTVDPLLAEFERAHGTRPRLVPAGESADPLLLVAPLGNLLAGWQLEAASPGGTGAAPFADLGAASIAVSIGLASAVALVSVAIVLALRREQALVELRNRFVANVSHELKTPLSLIRMYAETLYLGRLRDPERQHEYHRVLLAEAERLSRMIGDVLDFARVRDGTPVYRLAETDLRGSVLAALGTYLPEWSARGARIGQDIAAEVPAVAHDPHGVVQILLNLVDNAIKYGGAEANILIRLAADRDRALLEVIDDGPGLDPATHQRLWRALQRGQAAPDAEGSGLGLALVKQVADAHEASFVLDAGPDGRGLCAQISFPRYAGAA